MLILGLRKAGKSSSFQVVYESLNPEDALQEGVTQAHKSEPYNIDTFHRMRIWDGTNNFTSSSAKPTGLEKTDAASRNRAAQKSEGSAASNHGKGEAAFGTGGQLYWTECSAVIFVVDSQVGCGSVCVDGDYRRADHVDGCQGEYFEALERLNDVILSAYSYNPLIHFHVFVHKADGHSNDYRYGEAAQTRCQIAGWEADEALPRYAAGYSVASGRQSGRCLAVIYLRAHCA